MSQLEEELKIPGPNYLKELLTTCSDPIEAITNFQAENSIRNPTLNPALRLLDLHGIRRSEYHESVLADLQDRLATQIRSLCDRDSPKASTKSVTSLLEKSFPLVKTPFIRKTVLDCLNNLPKIPEKYLRKIQEDSELYAECSIQVRQQVWILDEQLFKKEIRPEIEKYVAEKVSNLRVIENSKSEYFRRTGKARRQFPGIQNLVQIVGSHVTLYDSLLQFIRQEFLEKESIHLCSLRFDLLMALHDNDVKSLIELDPCHRFAWCLDPCVRDKHLHPNQSAELKYFMDSKKRDVQIWGDVAMIAADPQVTFFFGKLAIHIISQNGINSEILPRELQTLPLILRILSHGLDAKKFMEREEKSKECGKIDPLIFTKFLPKLMSIIAEDLLRIELTKMEDASEFEGINTCTTPPKLMVDFLKSDPICAHLWLQYVLEVAKRKDKRGLCRAIPFLTKCHGNSGFSEPFLQEFITQILSCAGAITTAETLWASTEDFCKLIFDKYLLIGLKTSPAIRWHLFRILFHIGSKLPAARVDKLLDSLDPTKIEDLDAKDIDNHGWVLAKVQQRIAVVRAEKESEPQSNTTTDTPTTPDVVERLGVL